MTTQLMSYRGSVMPRSPRIYSMRTGVFNILVDVAEISVQFGRDVADEVLDQADDRLHGLLSSTDPMVQLGRGRFVALIPAISNSDEATRTAEVVSRGLLAPYEVAGKSVTPSVNIGISVSGSNDRSSGRLMAAAATAARVARASGATIYLAEAP